MSNMAIVYNKDSHGNTVALEEMLRRFKRKVQADGIMDDLKKREFFVSKSVKRREKIKRNSKYRKYQENND